MKILYVVARPLEINTSASIRNRATIQGLINNGHSVDIFTSKPDENHMAYDSSMMLDGASTTYVEIGGAQKIASSMRRKGALYTFARNMYFRFVSGNEIYDNLKGIVRCTDRINLKEKNYDVIISSSDPKSSHLFVDKLLENEKSFSGRWIQIWGDPFAGDITVTKNHGKIKKEEERLISKADKVVYVSRLTLEQQKKLYPRYADKMTYQPIPYLNKNISPANDLSKADTLKLVYCGDYSSHIRNIKPLYECVENMSECRITVCGNTDLNLESKENIDIMPRQPFSKVEELEKDADILVHLSNLHGGQIPGKIYQYSSTNKPILFILDGDKKALTEQFSSYGRFSFADNDADSIKEAILGIKTENRVYEPIEAFSKESIAVEILK